VPPQIWLLEALLKGSCRRRPKKILRGAPPEARRMGRVTYAPYFRR